MTTYQDIRERYVAGHSAAIEHHRNWERAQCQLLCEVGQGALTLLRGEYERLGDMDIAARKTARARVIEKLEAELPKLEAMPEPLVSRWLRWAAVLEVVQPGAGLKQAHMMALEPIVDLHETTGEVKLKAAYDGKLELIRAAVAAVIVENESAATLKEVLGEMVTPVAPVVEVMRGTIVPEPTVASPVVTPQNPTKVGFSPKPAPNSPQVAATPQKPPQPISAPRITLPEHKGTIVPEPQPADLTGKAQIAEEVYRMLQDPDIRRMVFRRHWNGPLIRDVAKELKAFSDKENLACLAGLYLESAPLVRQSYEDRIDEGQLKLVKKQTVNS